MKRKRNRMKRISESAKAKLGLKAKARDIMLGKSRSMPKLRADQDDMQQCACGAHLQWFGGCACTQSKLLGQNQWLTCGVLIGGRPGRQGCQGKGWQGSTRRRRLRGLLVHALQRERQTQALQSPESEGEVLVLCCC